MTDFNKKFKEFLLKENEELEEAQSGKPIPFKKLLQLVKKSYGESMGSEDEFEDVENISDLVNVLDELGFNGDEAYEMIFDSISPKPFPFSQILQLVRASYSEMADDSDLRGIKNIPDLVNTLDEMGFNGEEAFEFIFDSIIDDSSMMQESETSSEIEKIDDLDGIIDEVWDKYADMPDEAIYYHLSKPDFILAVKEILEKIKGKFIEWNSLS